ncbi:tail fiber domain-containing protein [bacterium]
MRHLIELAVVLFLLIWFYPVHAQMTVKDSDTHILMQVHDEGDGGSLMFPVVEIPADPSNKLYNVSGSIYWDGSALATAGSAGGWTDDGTVVRLTTGSDKVGIGTATPAEELEIYKDQNDWTILRLNNPDGGGNAGSAIYFFEGITYRAYIASANSGNSTAISGPNSLTMQCSNGPIQIRTVSSYPISLLPASGNVGIGTYNPSSETALHIQNAVDNNFGVLVEAGGIHGSEIGLHTGEGKYASLVKNGYFAGGGWQRFDTGSGAFLQEVQPDGSAKFKITASGTNPISWTDVVTMMTSGKVGIGDTSPTHQLDVAGKVGINDIQILYLPDQTDFTGTLYVGNGGGSLGHSSGDQGMYNTAIGIGASNANTEGAWNTSVGYRALYINTSGDGNTANGSEALYSNTIGDANTASGMHALFSNTSGDGNTANGFEALYYNKSGEDNNASGVQALYFNSTGEGNTASGYTALYYNSTGHGNTACGAAALLGNSTGSYNTAIGAAANVSSGNLTNATAIGYSANVNASNKVRIGDANVTVIEGQVGFTASSDSSKKENLIDVDGNQVLDKIHDLRLTSWNFKGQDAQQCRHYGPMAQDFFAAFGHDGFGTVGNDTTICSSDLQGINMIAIQALEKRTAENEKLKMEVTQLKNELSQLRIIVADLCERMEDNDIQMTSEKSR